MSDAPHVEWPREIWMAEREEHDQGVVSAVLSEHATVARWEGDHERDRDFHRYIDADIYDSAEKYWKARHAELTAELDRLRAMLAPAVTYSIPANVYYRPDTKQFYRHNGTRENENFRNAHIELAHLFPEREHGEAGARKRADALQKDTDND